MKQMRCMLARCVKPNLYLLLLLVPLTHSEMRCWAWVSFMKTTGWLQIHKSTLEQKWSHVAKARQASQFLLPSWSLFCGAVVEQQLQEAQTAGFFLLFPLKDWAPRRLWSRSALLPASACVSVFHTVTDRECCASAGLPGCKLTQLVTSKSQMLQNWAPTPPETGCPCFPL